MNDLQSNISDISNNHYRYLMSLKNVNGIGLSYKHINEKNTFEPCLCVLVKNKINNKFLTSNNIIPKQYMGIKTDVLSVGEMLLTAENTKNIEDKQIFYKMRPLKAGAIIGPSIIGESGTICCIVKKVIKKRFSKQVIYYILSANHILAGLNSYPINTLFMQPSLKGKGRISTDIVASLSTFIPLKFLEDDYESENLVDAAIAEINNKNIISNEIFSQGKIKGTTEPALLMLVKKVGCKTGLTYGHIRTVNTSIKLPITNKLSAIFKNQIISELKTKPGDSGSCIFTRDNKIVGMHIATGGDGFSVANNINIVLKELNVKLYKS